MILRLLKTTFVIIIIIGFYWLFKILYLDIPKAEGNPLNPSKIVTQTFLVNSNMDTILTTNSGSLMVIRKNSFVNSNGQLIRGEIDIKYKEILAKADIILSGLITTSDGRILESGGMIYVDASYNNQRIYLGDSSKIGFAINSVSIENEMQLFKGKQQQGIINWIEPEPLLNDTVAVLIQRSSWNQDQLTKKGAIRLGILYEVILTGDRLLDDLDDILSDAPELDLDEINRLTEVEENLESSNSIIDSFKPSLHKKYLFELYELGWANIDRFYNNDQAKVVDFNINLDNLNDFGDVYVRLCFVDMNIQLAAQKNDAGIFTLKPFSGINPKLPIGEEIIVIASATKDGYIH